MIEYFEVLLKERGRSRETENDRNGVRQQIRDRQRESREVTEGERQPKRGTAKRDRQLNDYVCFSGGHTSLRKHWD